MSKFYSITLYSDNPKFNSILHALILFLSLSSISGERNEFLGDDLSANFELSRIRHNNPNQNRLPNNVGPHSSVHRSQAAFDLTNPGSPIPEDVSPSSSVNYEPEIRNHHHHHHNHISAGPEAVESSANTLIGTDGPSPGAQHNHIESNKFQRVNELETFLDEMNHNELRDVAAGRPIGDLFHTKPAPSGQHPNAPVTGSQSSEQTGLPSSDKSAMISVENRSMPVGLDRSQSTERSTYSDCALILQRTYVKNAIDDPKHHSLVTVPFGRTEQACIGYKHIDKAIEQAKHKLKFRDFAKKRKANGPGPDPLGPLHSSLEPPSDLIAALGEINMATTQILADQFDLSNDELLNGLPLIDVSKTKFWPLCPLLVRQDLKCEIGRFRSMTGHCNNLKHPTWGAAMTPFARYLPPTHPDGIWTPRKSIINEITFHLSAHGPGSHGHVEEFSGLNGPMDAHHNVHHEHMHQPNVNHLPISSSGLNEHVGPSDESMAGTATANFYRDSHTSVNQGHPMTQVSSEAIVDNQFQKLINGQQFDGRADNILQAATMQIPPPPPAHLHVHQSARKTPAELPPVRLISTVVHSDADVPAHDFSILFMSWGQLLDHDMSRAAQPPSSIKCCGPDEPGANPKHKLCLPIKVPEDDPFYSKFNVKCLEFRRSLAGLRPNCVLGPRVHQNAITGPIDANFVYGSSQAESDALRLFRGGRLRDRDWFKHQSLKPLLPAQEEEPDQDCLGRPQNLFCFLAGDVRANEQIHLTVLHTHYMREHNRIADKLADLNPHWNDERIFQEARHIVAAGVQHVMITEYIPILIGRKMSSLYNLTGHINHDHHQMHHTHFDEFSTSASMHHHSTIQNSNSHNKRSTTTSTLPINSGPLETSASSASGVAETNHISSGYHQHHGGHDSAYWHGYDPSVTTSVSNSFAAAAFRQGHTFIQGTVERYNKFHEFLGSEKLRHLFKQPFLLYQPGAVDELTAGLINQPAQQYDPFISVEIAGHLFQSPDRQFGHDLASINLQRGREQGLPGYNLFREWCGLPRVDSFHQLAPFLTNKTAYLYSRLYKHVDDIDLWSGGISERRLPGAAIGPTFACIIARQFSNTRRGDRFWYENPGLPSSFTPEQLGELRKISLAKILCSNSDDLPTIQRWALRMPHPILNPRIPCDQLPEMDLRFWQEE